MEKDKFFDYVLDEEDDLNYDTFIDREQFLARYYGINIFRLYLSEIMKYPLLTKDQEVKFGKKLKLRNDIKILNNFSDIEGALIVDLETVFVSIVDEKSKKYVLDKLREYYLNNGKQESYSNKIVKYYLDEYEKLCKISDNGIPSVDDLNSYFKGKKYDLFDDFDIDKRMSCDELIEQIEMFFQYMVARDLFINCNLRLVVKIANLYANPRMKRLDCIQEGNLGLIRAVDKFDVDMGYKFSTYATYWINQKILRAKEKCSLSVAFPYGSNVLYRKIGRLEEKYLGDYGRVPTAEEMAEILGVSPSKIVDCKKMFNRYDCCCLEDIVLEDKESDIVENITGDDFSFDIDDIIDGIVDIELLEDFNTLLTSRHLEILKYRFGFTSENGEYMTLQHTGDVFGVTRERIRQIEINALDKLRKRAANTDNYGKSKIRKI